MSLTEHITRIDFSVLYWIQENIRCAFLDAPAAWLSYLFEGGLLWVVLSAVLLCRRSTRVAGIMVLCSMLLTLALGELIIKNLVGRLRPCDIDTGVGLLIQAPGSYSFPSGHTSSSFAAAGVLISHNKRLGIPAIIVAVAVGLSRLYLFVHFPTDVLVGAVFGLLCALATVMVFRKTGLSDKLSKPVVSQPT